jgi:hypothetical protein
MTESSKAHAAADAGTEFEKIQKELAQLREDFARLAKALAKEAKGDLPEEARRLFDSLSQTSEHSLKAVAREVEERPLTSLFLAFCAGFLGSALLRR